MITEAMLEKYAEHAMTIGVKLLICLAILLLGIRIIKLIRNILKKSLTKAGLSRGYSHLWTPW